MQRGSACQCDRQSQLPRMRVERTHILCSTVWAGTPSTHKPGRTKIRRNNTENQAVSVLTFRSYEHDARMLPNFGCAHATCRYPLRIVAQPSHALTVFTCQTGPSWPAMLADRVCWPGSGPTSNILMIRSDEQVARRLP